MFLATQENQASQECLATAELVVRVYQDILDSQVDQDILVLLVTLGLMLKLVIQVLLDILEIQVILASQECRVKSLVVPAIQVLRATRDILVLE